MSPVVSGVDVAALAVLLVALLLGLSTGIIRLALGVVSVVVGGLAAFALADPAARRLGRWIGSPEAALLAGFVGVFAVTLLAFSLVAWLVRRSIARLGLGWVNRGLGAAAGAGIVVAGAASLAVLLTWARPEAAIVRQSRLVRPLAAIGQEGLEALPASWRRAYRRAGGSLAAQLGGEKRAEPPASTAAGVVRAPARRP